MNHLPVKRLLGVTVVWLALVLAGLTPASYAQSVAFKNAPNSPIGVGNNPSAIAVGDFNGDGIADIAVINGRDNTVTLLLGKGDGTFSPAANSPFIVNLNPISLNPLSPLTCVSGCSSVPLALVAGDFNRDGHLDLAVTNLPINDQCSIGAALFGSLCSSVSILWGDPANPGSFLPSNNFDPGGHLPVAIAVGDFNGDGNPDLAIANLNDSTIQILLGDGKGNFSAAKNSPFAVGNSPTAIAVGDLNGDGKLDLAVANGGDNTVSILMGNGDGTFIPFVGSPMVVGSRPSSVVLADFNGDGHLDLAVANLLDSTVGVALGNGSGSFSPLTIFPVGRYPTSLAAADFNRDGKLDLAVADSLSHMVSVLLGNGDGTFATYRNFSVAGNPQSLMAADFNGDGQPDFAVANLSSNSVSVLLNSTDVVPPATVATALPLPNLAGWNNSDVTVTLTSVDNPGGSGVKQITYSASGGQPIGTTVVAGSTASFLINTEGITSISYFGTDNAGNIESAHQLNIFLDKTPPTIVLESPVNGGTYVFDSLLLAAFYCTDNLSGQATCMSAPSNVTTFGTQTVGPHSFTVNATDIAGNSATVTNNYTVVPAPSSVGVTSSNNPSLFGVPITFTATVANGVAPVSIMTGMVNFMDGTTTLATEPLSSGTAQFTTSSLAVGSHSITAVYSGDTNFMSSSSTALAETISPSATLQIVFAEHAVLDGTHHPQIGKIFVPGAPVRVFTRGEPCTNGLAATGQPKIWGPIFETCPILQYGNYVAQGTTDANGQATIIVPPTLTNPDIDYVVIAKTNGFEVDPDDDKDSFYSGKEIGNAPASSTVKITLRRLRLFSNRHVPAGALEEYGTYLAIVQPDYMDWQGTQEQYPIVLEADGDWSVESSVTPPPGFIADTSTLSDTVNSSTGSMQFTMTDVGSEWTGVHLNHTIHHKGQIRHREAHLSMFDKKDRAKYHLNSLQEKRNEKQ